MRYSLSEYILYINIRLVAAIFRIFPLRVALLIGRFLGTVSYWFDFKHKRVAYRNLRIALSKEYSIPQLKLILKRNYQNFGMNVVEALRMPRMNKDYMRRYIKVVGGQHLETALKAKKGAIILSSHFGNWEICFGIGGILEYPFYILAEEQAKNPLLGRYLNQIRQSQGIGVLKGTHLVRQVIRVLRERKFVVMVADHGIREGALVDFFGRKARTPTMAIRISLKSDIPLLITYIRRIQGPEHQLVILPPLQIQRTGNFKQDVIANLETINKITQSYIAKYPEQYLWFYKRFKYSNQRNILLLHDGKMGHLRQVQAVSGIILEEAKKRNLEIRTKEIQVSLKGRLSSIFQALSLTLAGRNQCQGCLWCVKYLLTPRTFRELQSYFADIVISCGSRIAAVNSVISSENQAKSVVLMRPGTLSTKRFDLVIMPAHDNPPKRHNVVTTSGALNLVDEGYIKSQALSLKSRVGTIKNPVLGLLLGGDTKRFKLTLDLLKPLIREIKLFLERHDGSVLITTSRRTSPEVENLIKQEFKNYNRTKLLVIANEKNIPEAVGGILGLSQIVIISAESISMISEAANSGKYVVVFRPKTNIGRRHGRFLRHCADRKYIYLSDSDKISWILEEIVTKKPENVKLQDRALVKEALARLL